MVYWTESLQGVEHYRVLTPEKLEALVPTWMFRPETFDAVIVSDPVIELAALTQLQVLVQMALSSLHSDPQPRENSDEECKTTASPLSSGRDLSSSPAQRDLGERR